MRNAFLALILTLTVVGITTLYSNSAPAPLPRRANFTLSHSQVIVGGTSMTEVIFDKGEVKMSYKPDEQQWITPVSYSGVYSVRGNILYVRMKSDRWDDENYSEYTARLTKNPEQVIELELVPEKITTPPMEEN